MTSPYSIIRIGGTAYSGSTALDLMLANANDVFSCGEIDALFRPYRMHHFVPECGCGDVTCEVWKKIYNAGESLWVDKVIHMFPETNWIVDSSKDLNWILDQNMSCDTVGIPVKNLLIWKTPADYAYSLFKRGKIKGWLRSYMLYHERYLGIVNDWVGVPYAELAAEPAATLKLLCNFLGMNYEEGREQYWLRQYHTIFGNHSAKLHLHDRDSNNYQSIAQELKTLKPEVKSGSDQEVSGHKSIYYNSANLERLPRDVVKDIETNKSLHDLVTYLEQGGISNVGLSINGLTSNAKQSFSTSPAVWYHYLKIKRSLLYHACILRRTYNKLIT